MTHHDLPLDDLAQLAEQEMEDKRRELSNERQARELYDVPTESDEQIVEQQEGEAT